MNDQPRGDWEEPELPPYERPATLSQSRSLLLPERLKQIERLVKAGKSRAEIAEAMQVTYPALTKAIKRYRHLRYVMEGHTAPDPNEDYDAVASSSTKDLPLYVRLRNWARNGVSEGAMAALLGLTPETFAEELADDPEMVEAISMGKASREELLSSAITALVEDPNAPGHVRGLSLALRHHREDRAEEEASTPPTQLSPEELRALLGGPK